MEKKMGFYHGDNVQELIITGVMGSGKTRFCRQLLSTGRQIYINKKRYYSPYIHIEVDQIGKIFLPQYLQSRGYKNLLELKKKLFFSSPHIQNRAWKDLENFSHPRIQQKIYELRKKLRHKKGTILWDCALSNIFFSLSSSRTRINNIFIPSKKLYPSVFLLQKYRQVSFREIFSILRKQK